MLVLSRKQGERILVGEQIAVTVVRIGPNSVRLGIEAPHDLNIVREELVLDVPLDCGDCREEVLDCRCVETGA